MRKSNLKKTGVALLAAFLLMNTLSIPASAASYVSGNMGGIQVYGTLSMNNTSATATTGSGVSTGHSVSVSYTYGFGTNKYTVYSSNSDSKTVSATASSNHYGSVALSAAGSHSVWYQSYSWSDSTSIN